MSKSMLLCAQLFGSFKLVCGATAVPLPNRATAKTLLAYLLLHREQSHSRARLAFLLAPDAGEEQARRRLSKALWHIRQSLPLPLITADGDYIQVTQDASLVVDVEEFVALTTPHLHSDQLTEAGATAVQQAIALYRGDLLDGFYEDWALLRREQLREDYLQTLWLASRWEKEHGRYPSALRHLLQLTRAAPLHETAHRELMRLYAALDRPQDARRQYQTLRRALADELDLEPGGETIALAQAIARQSGGDAAAPHLPLIPSRPAPIALRAAAQMPLIGRQEEREVLLTYLSDTLAGRGGVVLLEGEPGMGKSRLLQEVARDGEWRGAQAVWGYEDELTAVPYGALVAALVAGLTPLRWQQVRQLVDDVWLAAVAPLLPHAPGDLPHLPPLKPDQEQTRLWEALARLILALGALSPLLIILEDLHWADEATFAALAYLSRQLGRSRVLLIGSYRGEDARANKAVWGGLQRLDKANGQRRLQLAPLPEEGTADLIRQGLGLGQDAPRFAALLHRQSGGNPLFILETLRALHDDGLLYRDEQGLWRTPYDDATQDYAELRVPAAGRSLVARRLRQLPSEAREILEAAAVIGHHIPYPLLEAAVSLDTQDALDALHTLTQRQFLLETAHAYQFNHDLVRQAVYGSIPPAGRVPLHRRVAQAIGGQTPGQVEALAYHALRGEVWGTAVTANIKAGQQAAALYANAAALERLNQALHLLETRRLFPDGRAANLRFDALITRRHIAWIQGDVAAQQADLTELGQLAQLLDDPQRQIEILLHQSAFYCHTTGELDQAHETAETALALAQEQNRPDLMAQAWQAMGRARHAQQRLQTAESALQTALSLWQELDELASTAALEARLRLAQVYEKMGDFAQAEAEVNALLTLAQENDEKLAIANANSLLGNIASWRGDHEASIAHKQTSLAQMQAIGIRENEARLLGNLGFAHWSLGDYEEAIAVTQQGLDIFRQLDNRPGAYISVENLGGLHREIGQFGAARAYLEEGVELARQLGQPGSVAPALCGLAEAALDLGTLDEAKRAIEEAAAIANDLEMPYTRGGVCFVQGLAQIAAGEWGTAALHFQRAIKWYEQAGTADFAAAARSFLALCHWRAGDLAAAVPLSAQAVAELEAQPGGEHVQAAYWHHYQIMGAAGEPTAAHDALLKGHDAVQKLAGSLSDPAWRESFLAAPPNCHILQAIAQLPPPLVVRLPHVDAPAGRPLQPDEYVTVHWTVESPGDTVVKGKKQRRQKRLLRLLREAAAQNAAPTINNLAVALRVSPGTIKRDLAALRQAGHGAPTRGNR